MTRQQGWFAFVVVAVMIAAVVFWSSSRGYGKVGEQTYQVAQATYAACMAKDEQRLQRVIDLLRDESFTSKIPDREMRWLEQILHRAKKGNWSAAAKSARRMLEDQVDS